MTSRRFLAAVMSILAIVVWRFVGNPVFALGIAAAVIALELTWARRPVSTA